MAETIDVDTFRTICEEVPEARVIVLHCCQDKETLQPALAAEPVNYVLKEVPVDQLADALREYQFEESTAAACCDSSSQSKRDQPGNKRTVVVLKVGG